ncbi:hypothetical protein RMQ97_10425 [Maricaulis sp. D1M11]|uniref:hypothetical protein n=1 Tax=Maricaulis sp. D1M11 TaxID=3076117 RepID=UPI0039B5050E
MGLGIALEVAIGLVFLYLVLSLFVTALVEGIAGGLYQLRQRTLRDGLRTLLTPRASGGESHWRAFRETTPFRFLTAASTGQEIIPEPDETDPDQTEPSVPRRLGFVSRIGPSSIAPRAFALSVLEWANRHHESPASATATDSASSADQAASQTLNNLRNIKTDTVLGAMIRQEMATLSTRTADGLNEAIDKIEDIYDRAIVRIQGEYQRLIRVWTLGMGFALAVILNANTIDIAQSLWADKTLREGLLVQAQAFAEADSEYLSDRPIDAQSVDRAMERMERFSDELGTFPLTGLGGIASQWCGGRVPDPSGHDYVRPGVFMTLFCDETAEEPHDSRSIWWIILRQIIGLSLTGIALSLGAPFWFDLLRKIMNLRSGGPSDPLASEEVEVSSRTGSSPAPAQPRPETTVRVVVDTPNAT